MPDISVGAQVFDLVFHPAESVVYAGLLTGEVKSFGYDEQGQHDQRFTLKPSKRSCRGLAIDEQGDRLWSVGKGKSLWYATMFLLSPPYRFLTLPCCGECSTIDTRTAQITNTRLAVHEWVPRYHNTSQEH